MSLALGFRLDYAWMI